MRAVPVRMRKVLQRHEATFVVFLLSTAVPCTGESVAGLEQVRELVRSGRFSEAAQGARALLTTVERERGADSPDAAELIDAIVDAMIWADQSSKPADRELAERALSIKERHFGGEHPETARSRCNLARVLDVSGDAESARNPVPRPVPPEP